MSGWLRTGRLLAGIGREIGPLTCLLYVAVSASSFVVPMLFALGLRPLVNGVVFGPLGQAVTGAILAGAALAASVLLPAGYRWTTVRLRERSIMVMQRRLLALATAAPGLAHFEIAAFWNRLQLLKRSTYDLVMGMVFVAIGPLVVLQLAVAAGLLARLQPLLLLLPVVAVPAAWLAGRAEAVRRAAELRTAEHRRTAQHLFSLASDAAPAKEIRLYGLCAELLDRHHRASQTVHHGTEMALARSAAVTAAGWLLFALAFVGAVVLVLRQAAAGQATPGDVALTLGLAAAVVAAAGQLTELASSALRTRTSAEHYLWLADQARPVTDAARRPPPARLARGVELDRVTFRYPAADRPVLAEVSLRLPAGAVVAVVGENGAGKTTMVKLLCGMYGPDQGRILIDGADLAGIDIDQWRLRLAAGFQDSMRFELVTREAVGVGDLPRIEDRDAVRTALSAANAGFADRLPAGLETQLGATWQGGVDLSGGEWQKLALARCMLRPTPLLVVLDEPTASLDPQTEHALFEQVAAESRRGRADGRITLLISHRFSTVRMADLIVVLDQGRVVEQGIHAELIGRAGRYAELYELQAHAYR